MTLVAQLPPTRMNQKEDVNMNISSTANSRRFKQRRRQCQRQHRKAMIWLVVWRKNIILHVQHARTCSMHVSTILWRNLPINNVKFPTKVEFDVSKKLLFKKSESYFHGFQSSFHPTGVLLKWRDTVPFRTKEPEGLYNHSTAFWLFKILTLCLCLPKYFHLWLCHAEPFRKQLGLKFTGLKYIKCSFFFPLSFEELDFKRYFAPFSY